jgi:hypothetical protein
VRAQRPAAGPELVGLDAGVTRDGRGLEIACPLPDLGEQLVRHRTRLADRLAMLD